MMKMKRILIGLIVSLAIPALALAGPRVTKHRGDKTRSVNLIGNAGFGVWSNSTLENVTFDELITNGTFDSDLSGWSDNSGATSSIAWSVDHLEITSTGVDYAVATQGVTTEVGKKYIVTFDIVSPGSLGRLRVGTTNGGEQRLAVTSIATGSHTYYFIASTTTSYVSAANGNNETQDWDNISVKEHSIAYDDAADDDTADWTVADCTLAFDTDHYELTGVAATEYAYINNLVFTKGKLYEVSVDVKDGTKASASVNIYTYSTTEKLGPTFLTTAAWVTKTFTFEATHTTTSGRAGVYILADISPDDFELRNFSVYEVTPGTIAANTLGPDTWEKDSTLDLYREHSGDNTKDGEFYSLKMVPSATNDYLKWPKDIQANEDFYDRFAGRTVTFGAWVKTSTASHALIRIYDGAYSDSSTHSGGGDWEWLEVTDVVSSTVSNFQFNIKCSLASGNVYVSQPMLVFGSSIGEGNYVPSQDKVINLELAISSVSLEGETFSTIGATTVNLETDTNGKLPKNSRAVYIVASVKDSGSAGSDALLTISPTSGVLRQYISPGGLTNDFVHRTGRRLPLDSSGDWVYTITASGANTFDITNFRYLAVELR